MKSRLLCLLILFPFISISQLDSLKGKVKSVKDSVIYTDKAYFILSLREVDFGQLSLSEDDVFAEFKGDLLPKRFIQFDKEREFDEKGRLIKFKYVFPKINSSSTRFYTYNEYNNLIQEKHEFSSGNFTTTNYHYRHFKDSSYRLAAEISYESDPERFSMKQYFYDRNVRLIEERELAAFEHDYKINYTYDDSGKLIAEIWTNINRATKYDSVLKTEIVLDTVSVSFRNDYKYYSDGSLLEKTRGCDSGIIIFSCQRTVYVYDDKKRKSKIYYYWRGTDSLFSRREYTYNHDNTIKKIAWFYKDESNPKNYAEYFYRHSEVTKVILTDSGKTTTIEFAYKLDSHNNWIEQKKFVNNDLFYTRKREIIYWD